MSRATEPRRTERAASAGATRPRRPVGSGWLLGLIAAGVLLVVRGHGTVVVLYAGVVVLVAVHELAHLVVARRCGIEASSLVVGVGPILLGARSGDTRVELRLVPLLGWVTLDDAAFRARPGRAALVGLAGPFANLLLCMGFICAAIAAAHGPGAVDRSTMATSGRVAVEVTLEVWTLPYEPLVDAAGAIVEGLAADPEGAASTSSPAEVEALPDAEPGEGGHEGPLVRGGPLVLLAGMSAAMAGFNLVPARGLDGYGVLESLATALYRRHRAAGRRARRVLSLVGTVSFVLGAWLIVSTTTRTVAGLVAGMLG